MNENTFFGRQGMLMCVHMIEQMAARDTAQEIRASYEHLERATRGVVRSRVLFQSQR
jgi:hypothetical protein